MSDTVFRSAPLPSAPAPEAPSTPAESRDPNDSMPEAEIGPEEAVESSEEAVLLALGIDEELNHLPLEDQENLSEIKTLLENIISQKGLQPTLASFKSSLESLREDMGLDPQAEPSVVLDRIAGVVKAWKSLTFVGDPKEKRSLFMKLARAQSSSEMNKIVYREMEDKQVWQ